LLSFILTTFNSIRTDTMKWSELSMQIIAVEQLFLIQFVNILSNNVTFVSVILVGFRIVGKNEWDTILSNKSPTKLLLRYLRRSKL